MSYSTSELFRDIVILLLKFKIHTKSSLFAKNSVFKNIYVPPFGCLLSYTAFKTLELHSQKTKFPPPKRLTIPALTGPSSR